MCILAILSFVASSYRINKSFVGVEIMEQANIQIESNNLDHLFLSKEGYKSFSRMGI